MLELATTAEGRESTEHDGCNPNDRRPDVSVRSTSENLGEGFRRPAAPRLVRRFAPFDSFRGPRSCQRPSCSRWIRFAFFREQQFFWFRNFACREERIEKDREPSTSRLRSAGIASSPRFATTTFCPPRSLFAIVGGQRDHDVAIVQMQLNDVGLEETEPLQHNNG